MKYRLGLDIGIASVGWSVMEMDTEDRPCRIVDLGVRKFEPAEKPKTGESPAVDRRIARGVRRNLRRKKERMDKVKFLLKTYLLNGKDIVFEGNNLYETRVKALDNKIQDNDIARIVYSITKHRGFKSNRKSELKEKETSQMNSAVNQNSEISKKYRSIGEMYLKEEKYFEERQKLVDGEEKKYIVYNIRNRDGKYDKTLLREDVLSEVETILTNQQKLGNVKITDEFIKKILHAISYQKSYDEGPDFPSPYRVSFNVGNCTFFKDEQRAPKGSFTYEYFTALCDINNLRIDGEKLCEEQRKLLQNTYLSFKEIKFKKVRTLLKLKEGQSLTGKSGSNIDERIFSKRHFSYEVMKTLKMNENPIVYQEMLDEISWIISMFKSDERRISAFNKNEKTQNLSFEEKQELCKLDFNKFGNLSIKAMKKLIPFLEKGEGYYSACTLAELHNESFEKTLKLKYGDLTELNDITSPVVKRSVSQTIKVVNAIIDKFGSPSAIFIELGREMNKNFTERKIIEKNQNENFVNNDLIYKHLKELGINYPSGLDIVKFKLYNQQQGKCIYSGKSFLSVFKDMKDVFSNNNTQIDHIIPYSRCYDDSFGNKVLVLSSENQRKGNRIPIEYLGKNEINWTNFVSRVNSIYVQKQDKSKKDRLLKDKLTISQEEELNSRALNDTRYIAKFLKNLFENHLLFAEGSMSKKPVRTVNGAMTSFLRKIWGIKKNRFEDDKHHATDASIIACTDNGIVQRVTTFLQTMNAKEIDGLQKFVDKSTGEIFSLEEIVNKFGKSYQMPYESFKSELEIRLSENVLSRKDELMKIGYSNEECDAIRQVFVSRMVNHKVTGPMHKETIKSIKLFDENADKLLAVTKTKLTELKLTDCGEIKDYPLKYRNDDRLLYEALKRRLHEFDGDAKKAFDEPFYKPTKSGKNGNIVNTVKLQETIGDGVFVKGGISGNGSMIRIDVFEKNNKNYFIPVYTIDFYNKKLPNKICKASTLYKDWPVLDDSYEFKFSLFQNDIIKIKSNNCFKFSPLDKNAENEVATFNDIFVYYNSSNRSVASVKIETIDGKYKLESMGIQGLIEFDKYEIDILGNIQKVKNEIRKEFV